MTNRKSNKADRYRQALEEIADPLSFWKKNLKPDEDLNIGMCLSMIDSPETYRAIARKALLGEKS